MGETQSFGKFHSFQKNPAIIVGFFYFIFSMKYNTVYAIFLIEHPRLSANCCKFENSYKITKIKYLSDWENLNS